MSGAMKLLLVGNPNAGKSTLFNRLTHGHAKVGNWHGVTVGVLEREATIGGRKYVVCDLPGIYSLDSLSMEEKVSRGYIEREKDAFLLFVMECAGIGRGLSLFFSLAQGRRAAVVLTKRKQFLRGGGFVDGEGLSRYLGVPVLFSEDKAFREALSAALRTSISPPPPAFPRHPERSEGSPQTKSTSAFPRHPERSEGSPQTKSAPAFPRHPERSEGSPQTKSAPAFPRHPERSEGSPQTKSAPAFPRHPERSEGSPQTEFAPASGRTATCPPPASGGGVGEGGRPELPPSLYRPPREGLSAADKFLLNGFFCVPLFLLTMLLVFFLTFAPDLLGDVLKRAVSDFFSGFLGGFADKIPSPAVRSLVRDGILGSLGSVLCFLPQISMLYLFLIVFEESGLLSRLAYLTDGLFSKVGLNGRAVFSLLMGFGCTAAAVLTTRGLDDKKMQRRAILCLPYIPCSAKLPVFLTLTSSFFEDPFPAVMGLYLLGVLLSLVAARLLRGKQPPFLMELAPLQFPDPVFVLKGLLFQIKQFIMKTATAILCFLLVSWALSSFDFSFRFVPAEQSMLAVICGGLKWLFAPAGMGDWRIAYAALSGLVAKENVAGAIEMFFGRFPYGAASAAAFSVFMLTCSPCISAVAATAREVGWRRALLYAAFQTVSALLLSYLTYFLWRGGVVFAILFALPLVALFLVRDLIENVHRKRRNHPENIHG